MRKPFYCISLLACLHAHGQNIYGSRWHTNVGVAYATVNVQKNMAGSLAIPVRYDFVRFGKSAFSLGTSLKFGSEDQYGWSFPVIALAMMIAGAAGADGSAFDNIPLGRKIQPFVETPFLLQYHFGLGVREWPNDHFGFYLGGGLDWTTTGFTDSAGIQHPVDFPGIMLGLGFRFSSNADLSFHRVMPMPFNRLVGNIPNPVMYEVSMTWNTDCHMRRAISVRRPPHR